MDANEAMYSYLDRWFPDLAPIERGMLHDIWVAVNQYESGKIADADPRRGLMARVREAIDRNAREAIKNAARRA